jgi:hypothetical protein
MAPLVLDEHVRALGERPESFPATRLEELVKDVSKEISTESVRVRFEKEALKEIQKGTERHEYPVQDPITPAAAISEKKSNGTATHTPATISNPTAEEANNGLPPEFFQVVIKKLLRAMGPMAPIVLLDHIRALGESSVCFPRARLEELAKGLSKEILRDSDRRRFEEEMAKEIQKLGEQRV